MAQQSSFCAPLQIFRGLQFLKYQKPVIILSVVKEKDIVIFLFGIK